MLGGRPTQNFLQTTEKTEQNDPPPCPTCGVTLTAIRPPDAVEQRFTCPKCEFTRAGLAYKGAAGLCHRCDGELTREKVTPDWWAARCLRCNVIAAFERVEPASVERLKSDWLKARDAVLVARITARECWEKFQAADAELRRVLTADAYKSWVDSAT